MPKNLKGGNKAKGLKNSTGGPVKNREIPVPEKEDDSHIVLITKCLGDSRFKCQIVSNIGMQKDELMVHMPSGVKNKYAKGIIIKGGETYALVSFREFQKDKGDVIFVYRDSEIPFLIERNLLVINKGGNNGNFDDDILFVDGGNNNIDINTI